MAKRILLVEDNPASLELMRYLLHSAGHEVLLATNGQEAIQHLSRQLPDMVLTDIQMPVVDGYALDVQAGVLSHAGRPLQLHATGLAILRRLMQAHPRPVSRQSLLEGLWGDEAPGSDPLRTHVYLLRQAMLDRFGEAPIHTERGIGYRFGSSA